MKNFAPCVWLVVALAMAPAAAAQQRTKPNGVFLVAKPGLADPNFSETVVLVTQDEDASTVGVIINRPTAFALRQLLPDADGAANYREPVFFGGPVMRRRIVALFRAESPPAAPAFHVLKDLYLTMHPDNIRPLLADGRRQFRLYAGFSGWAPRQLESEFERAGWHVLPADAETVFRRDPENVWQELVRRAEKRPVNQRAPAHERKAPPQAGLSARLHRAALQEQRFSDAAGCRTWSPLLRRLLHRGADSAVPGRLPGIPLYRGWATRSRLQAPVLNLALCAPVSRPGARGLDGAQIRAIERARMVLIS